MEPNKESPTQKASKQIVRPFKKTDACHQAQFKGGRVFIDSVPKKHVQDPTYIYSEYPLYFLSFTNVSYSLVLFEETH